MTNHQPTLGVALRRLREERGWTLKEMSHQSGIPFSTLAKIEHDRLSLTYDKIQAACLRLKISMADLLINVDAQQHTVVTGRRSIGRLDNAMRIRTENYDYFYLCPDLSQKSMIPIFTRIQAKSLEDFGPLVHHPGEECIFVLTGRVVVHTEMYASVLLEPYEMLYIDSNMGHAYVLAEGCEEAEILVVCYEAGERVLHDFVQTHALPSGDCPTSAETLLPGQEKRDTPSKRIRKRVAGSRPGS